MRPPETEGTAGKEDPRESPDVEIGAWAIADEVAFHQVPEVRTTFGGGGESAVEGSRENPPQGGEPGTSRRPEWSPRPSTSPPCRTRSRPWAPTPLPAPTVNWSPTCT